LRLGMVGGGPGAFIGAVHRIAARLGDCYELLAACLSSDAEQNLAAAEQLHISRGYRRFEEMASAESKRPDGIEVVSIVTPNHLHHAVAKTFLEAIHVIWDKPLTTTLADALDLAEMVKNTGLVFGLTHNYTGYPMVRQAREMVLAGELGPIRVIQVEYAQDWLSTPLERIGQKQAEWRTDPARSGPGGSLGDIGTHAFNLGMFCDGIVVRASGRRCKYVRPRPASRRQRSGDAAVFEWSKGGSLGEPSGAGVAPLGQPRRTIRRSGAGAGRAAAHATRIPSGHPEGYLEAFAQLYDDLAEQITARREGRPPNPDSLLVPCVSDSVEGIRFINAVLESSRHSSAWTAISGSQCSTCMDGTEPQFLHK